MTGVLTYWWELQTAQEIESWAVPLLTSQHIQTMDNAVQKKITTALLALSVIVGPAIAGNPDVGKRRATLCFSCHGQNGISPIPNYPNLKGQKEQYLVKALRAYRDGRRSDPTMSPMAKPLSDRDIDDLAAYFSSL